METGTHQNHSPNGNRTLVIMAKAPRAGMVKTRLSPAIPVDAVTDLYRCLLRDTMRLAHSLQDVNVAIMCPQSDIEELRKFTADAAPIVAQQGKGLAAGLTSVFAHFTADGRQRVIAFNSDSPHLPPSVLSGAFAALDEHDLIVGPTHDGGYYLVGARTTHATLFDGDGMGTNSALAVLLARARKLDLAVGFTEPFYDIDIATDLSQLAAELRRDPAKAPRTAAWLEQWQRTVRVPPAAGDR